jgi:ligand-binding SRPBCC domain-containing protein
LPWRSSRRNMGAESDGVCAGPAAETPGKVVDVKSDPDRAPESHREFEISSRLQATAAEVWAHATSMRGVNRELFPLARMTHPREIVSLDAASVPLGRRIFRSWILAGGLVPIDYDDVTFIELEPGRRFLERSPMLSQRQWQHERVVEPLDGGSIVTDRVRFVPRVAALAPLFLLVFRLAFRLRHRNLRRLFGGPGREGRESAAARP